MHKTGQLPAKGAQVTTVQASIQNGQVHIA
jgi:hypothetical protein